MRMLAAHLGDLAQRHRAPVGGLNQHLGGDCLRITAARIADADGVALAPLDRGRHGLCAERHRGQIQRGFRCWKETTFFAGTIWASAIRVLRTPRSIAS